MRLKKFSILFFIISTIFFLENHYYAGALLLAPGISFLWKWKNHPYKQLHAKFKEDARQMSVPIPDSQKIKGLLRVFYSKYSTSHYLFPGLHNTYKNLKFSVWKSLQKSTKLEEWEKVLTEIIDTWPEPKRAYAYAQGSNLSPYIKNAINEVQLWEQAKKEAQF